MHCKCHGGRVMKDTGKFPCSVCRSGLSRNSILSAALTNSLHPSIPPSLHPSIPSQWSLHLGKYKSCLHSVMLYASKTWPMVTEVWRGLLQNDNIMIHWICWKLLSDSIPTKHYILGYIWTCL